MTRILGKHEEGLRKMRAESLSKDPVIRQAQIDHAKAVEARRIGATIKAEGAKLTVETVTGAIAPGDRVTAATPGPLPEESVIVSTKTKNKSKARAKKAASKQGRRARQPNTPARKGRKPPPAEPGKDRSPLAVGTFIVAAGPAGRPMAELEKEFGIDAHPMRSKIFAARHEHGFTIDYDAKAKAYVGQAPKVAA